MGLLDVFFPKYCINCKKFGSYLCSNCFAFVSFHEGGFCVVCQRGAIGGITHPVCQGRYVIDGVFSSLVYTGIVKKLVFRFKYKPFLTDLEQTLSNFLYEGLVQKELFYRLLEDDIVFMPIPLHTSRMRMRGYNQSQLLAKTLGKRVRKDVVYCLERIKNTNRQVGLSQKEREENIKDAFQIKKSCSEFLKDCPRVCLVDDVVTTGATMKEAAKVLKKAGVTEVWGVTLAHGN